LTYDVNRVMQKAWDWELDPVRQIEVMLAALEEAGYVVVERDKVKRLQRAVDIALGVEDEVVF
jgi:hypothetical protein